MILKTKIAIGLAGLTVVGASAGFLIACGQKTPPPLGEMPSGTDTEYVVPTDGSTPLDHTAVENLGYMAARLKGQPSYYAEMHGLVDTMVNQDVESYKQYSDGVLILTEISQSSLVKTAKEFCYVGNDVLWREAAGSTDTWNGIDTAWKTEDPVYVSVEDFKATYGLPATEFSPYILTEDTVESAEEVVDNGDGTYTQTYHLNPAGDKAPYYYRQQMMMTGGLDEWPEYEFITLTYTFDETWQVLKAVVSESYSAKMVVSVKCQADYETVYEYGTEKAISPAYDEFYSNFADKPVEELPPVEPDPTAASCLTQGFANVLNGGATFDLSLRLNGTPISGVVYVDATDMSNLVLRAQIENLNVWLEGNAVYLSYGDLKACLPIEGVTELLASVLPEEGLGEAVAIDTDELMAQLGGGEFFFDETSASISSTIELLGLSLPLEFAFNRSEEGISLNYVKADVNLTEDFTLAATLSQSEEELSALTEEEKTEYIDLIPYANALVDLFTKDVLSVGAAYEGEGFSLDANVQIDVKEFALIGEISVAVDEPSIQKTVHIGYTEGGVYVNLDGIKVMGYVEDVAQLIAEYLTIPEVETDISAVVDLLVNTLFGDELQTMLSLAEEENTLTIGVKGTELLAMFGVDFALGDVALSVKEGEVAVSVLGANVTLTEGVAFTVDTQGYADVVTYVDDLISFFTETAYEGTVSYGVAGEGLSVTGSLFLDVTTLQVEADVTVAYATEAGSVEKRILLAYANETGEVYLTLAGEEEEFFRFRASVEEAVALIANFVQMPAGDEEGTAILEDLLSLPLGNIISITEAEDTLTVAVKGTELLTALGVDFALGDVVLSFSGTQFDLNAFGASVTITHTQKTAAAIDAEAYIDVVPYVNALVDLFTKDILQATVTYASEEISVNGEIALSLADLRVNGTVTVSAFGAQKTVLIGFEENVLYATLDGIKIKGSVEEIVSLVSQFVGGESEVAEVQVEDLLFTLLSDDVLSLIAIAEEENTLTVAVKGTELLAALGVDFALGDVVLSVKEGEVAASVLGANVTLTEGEAFTVEKEGYVGVLPYVNSLIDLFTADVLFAELSFAMEGIALEGGISINLNTLSLGGELTATVAVDGVPVTKTVQLGFEENVLFAALDGIKVKGSVEEIVSLVSQFVGGEDTAATQATEDLLASVFALNFGEIVTLAEEENTLALAIKGTELLAALGVDFALGDVVLSVKEGEVAVSVLGANVTLTEGEAFTVDTEGYVGVLPYVNSLIDLFTADVLQATIAYGTANRGILIDGNVLVDMKQFNVEANLTVSYVSDNGSKVEKTLVALYGKEENVIYLTLVNDGGNDVRVKADVDGILSLLGGVLPIESGEEGAEAESMLANVLSLNFGDYVSLSEENGTLSVLLKGTELLTVFGVDFALGDVTIGVQENALTANVFGAEIAVTASQKEVALASGTYADISLLPKTIVDVVTAQSITLGGALELTVGEEIISLEINEGYLSWKNGVEAYLDATLLALDTAHSIVLSANEQEITLSYGAIGATLFFEELASLEEAIASVYNRIGGVVNEIMGKETLAPVQSLEEILALLGVGTAVGAVSGEEKTTADTIVELLNGMTIAGPSGNHADGVLTIALGGLTVELLGEGTGDAELAISFVGDGIAIGADVFAKAYGGELPTLSKEGMLTAAEFVDLIDYLGAAAESLLLDSATVSFDAAVTSTDEAYAEANGVRYQINGNISYYSGGSVPVHIDLDNQKFWINTDLYANISLNALATNEDVDDSFYFGITILDTDGNDELEIFLSVSRFTESHEAFAPLKLYAPVGELATVLSAVVAITGIEIDFLESALVSEWLSAETTAQLRALGNSLKLSLNLEELLGGLLAPATAELAETKGAEDEEGVETALPSGIFNGFTTVTGESILLTLNSSMLYGAPAPADLQIGISKGTHTIVRGEEERTCGYISGITLKDVYYDNTFAEKIDLNLSVAQGYTQAEPSLDGYYKATGLGALVKMLAKSATHVDSEEIISGEEAEHNYVINRNFYISGSAELDAFGIIDVSVDVVAISVTLDEDNKLGVNIRLEYQGVQELNQVAINGDSSIDVTLKDGMVYMKRTQYSYWQKGLGTTKEAKYDSPIVIYRAMPMANFFSDVANQLFFMLNFGDLITGMIPSDGGSGDDSGEATTVTTDYGTEAKKTLIDYAYAQNESGATWTIVLDGENLTDGILGELTVVLSADANGFLRALNLNCPKVGISGLTLSANLNYHNPGNVMDAGVTDVTRDVEGEANDKMAQKLQAVDWTQTVYVEGGVTTVTYLFNGTVYGTQEVVYDPTTGECFATLNYPKLESTEVGYTPVWQAPAKIEGSGTNVYASYEPNVYTLTFVSREEADGFTYNEQTGMWECVVPYTYDTTIALPIGYTMDGVFEVVSYRDENGNEYTSIYNITSDLTLTAVWDYIDYTVTYVADGVQLGVQTAHYGDAFAFPEAPEKTGHTFIGWDVTSDTVAGNATVTALYEANTYAVTLVSEFALDGFDLVGERYEKTLSYVYGTEVSLPYAVRYENAYYLDGFTLEGQDAVYTAIPAVNEDSVLYAKWSEIGYEITFVDANGNTVATQNYKLGATLANLPAVPVKTGYTGTWQIAEGYTVTGEDTVTCAYTPNTYVITVYSAYAASGFASNGNGYSYNYDYTYDTAWTLPTGLDIAGYDFGGYVDANGNAVTQIYNVTQDTTVSVVWIDNTITVDLCSDIEFSGSSYSAKNSYFKTVKFNDVYTFNQTVPAPSGYKQFGWWAKVNGAWTVVTDVKAQALDGAQIWAAWIQDSITVTINTAVAPSSVWTIGGTYTGGSWYGSKSVEIGASVGVTTKEEIKYGLMYKKLLSSDLALDELNSGKWQDGGSIDGKFQKEQMSSWNGAAGRGKKGGAKVRLTYTYGSITVTVETPEYSWKDV